ncbi:MAG TPA: metallophosphoesterase family protein [Bacteroidales bacterium]|jgi:putative phosphoesterase|nr:metallophosphoesterase family protein [Bacteroidales bacterium]HOU98828.1 metallophosphoesterase family protein [Bacteroidales bacterium]
MALIGILSDTHAYLGDYVYRFFDDCEEIWHAGDVGSLDVLQALQHFKPTRAVWGNIDGSPIRKEIPAVQFIKYQGLRVFMRHIVGYPNKYDKSVVPILQSSPFDLVIAGHSHILRIMHDKKYNFLFINPGAAGMYGFHQKITLVKLQIEEGKIKDAFIWEKNK